MANPFSDYRYPTQEDDRYKWGTPQELPGGPGGELGIAPGPFLEPWVDVKPQEPVTNASGRPVDDPPGEEGEGGDFGGIFAGMGFAPKYNIAGAPKFAAPKFRAPTFEEAQAEPGYQFRLQGGRDALERSAAARGVLRTGGTLKDIDAWGQNFAAQEYGNVFNRALQGFDREYQGAKDMFAPTLLEWQTRAAAEQRAKDMELENYWKKYFFDTDLDFRREEGVLNRGV